MSEKYVTPLMPFLAPEIRIAIWTYFAHFSRTLIVRQYSPPIKTRMVTSGRYMIEEIPQSQIRVANNVPVLFAVSREARAIGLQYYSEIDLGGTGTRGKVWCHPEIDTWYLSPQALQYPAGKPLSAALSDLRCHSHPFAGLCSRPRTPACKGLIHSTTPEQRRAAQKNTRREVWWTRELKKITGDGGIRLAVPLRFWAGLNYCQQARILSRFPRLLELVLIVGDEFDTFPKLGEDEPPCIESNDIYSSSALSLEFFSLPRSKVRVSAMGCWANAGDFVTSGKSPAVVGTRDWEVYAPLVNLRLVLDSGLFAGDIALLTSEEKKELMPSKFLLTRRDRVLRKEEGVGSSAKR